MNNFSSNNNSTLTLERRILAVMMVLAITAILIVGYLLWPMILRPEKRMIFANYLPEHGIAAEGHLPGMTEEAIKEQMQRIADKNVFSFKINSQPSFKDGASEGTLRIENPNHNIYPFVVKIFLNDTAEEIYNSGGILPNHHIETATLTKDLPKGRHGATAYIYAYDPATNEYGGKSAVDLTINVAS